MKSIIGILSLLMSVLAFAANETLPQHGKLIVSDSKLLGVIINAGVNFKTEDGMMASVSTSKGELTLSGTSDSKLLSFNRGEVRNVLIGGSFAKALIQDLEEKGAAFDDGEFESYGFRFLLHSLRPIDPYDHYHNGKRESCFKKFDVTRNVTTYGCQLSVRSLKVL